LFDSASVVYYRLGWCQIGVKARLRTGVGYRNSPRLQPWSTIEEERRRTALAGKEHKARSAVKDKTRKIGASGNSTVYRSATTGRYVTRSANRDPSKRAREIRGRFRAAGRRFSGSSEIVRKDRDSVD
jgi:hypothetical protein